MILTSWGFTISAPSCKGGIQGQDRESEGFLEVILKQTGGKKHVDNHRIGIQMPNYPPGN